MKTTTTGTLAIVIALLFATSCTKQAQNEVEEIVQEIHATSERFGEQLTDASEQVSNSLTNAGKGLAEALQNVQNAVEGGIGADAADFREIQKALPEAVGNLTPAPKPTGESRRELGLSTSHAQRRYSAENGGELKVKISDGGTMRSLLAIADKAQAAALQYDRETETGFERTSRHLGGNGTEMYDGNTGRSEINLLYADRFLIYIEAYNVPWETMIAARDAIDFEVLNGLTNQVTKTVQAPKVQDGEGALQ